MYGAVRGTGLAQLAELLLELAKQGAVFTVTVDAGNQWNVQINGY